MSSKNKTWKKRILAALLCATMVLPMGGAFAAEENEFLDVYINEHLMIFDGNVSPSGADFMMPMQEFVELFGGTYTWNESEQAASCTVGATNFVAQNNSNIGKVGGKTVSINPMPYVGGTTFYAPLSFLASAMNLAYTYNKDANEIRITQKNETVNVWVTNEVYLSKNSNGVLGATLNPSGSNHYCNTDSTGTSGELFYEIDMSNVPEKFSKAELVMTATKVNVKGKYRISEVLSGWNETAKFGSATLIQGIKVELDESFMAPRIENTPTAIVDSGLNVRIDLTGLLTNFVQGENKILRLNVDYHTWETKATWDGMRVKAIAQADTAPHLAFTVEPDLVIPPDFSNVKRGKTSLEAKESSRIYYKDGVIASQVKDAANAGNSLNTLAVRGNNRSEISYKFPVKVNGNVKSSAISLRGRATVNGTLTLTNNTTGQTATQAIAAAADYADITFDAEGLMDINADTLDVTLTYTPDEGASGVLYLYSIDSVRAPQLTIMTQTIVQ